MTYRRINLGDRVRDVTTGIEGFAFGRSEYLTGCDHIGIKRDGTGSDGKPFDIHWCDEPVVELTGKPRFVLPDRGDEVSKPGGPALHRHSR